MPYISRVLGPSGVGINSFTNSNTQYFILLGSIGVSMYGNRQIAYYRDNKKETSQIFWEVFIMRFITIIGALMLFNIFINFNKVYYSAYMMQSILIIAAAFDISWFFMGVENFKVTVLRNIIIKIISLICIFTFVKSKNNLIIYIAILSLSQLLGNLSLFPYLKEYITLPEIKTLKIFRHFKPSLILFVPQIATQVYLILNKTMLGTIVSVDATGFYDNSDKIIKMVLAIVTATGTVMLPRVANTFAKGDHEKVNEYLYKSFDFVSAIAIPMMFGIAAISLKFAPIFFGSKFQQVSYLMMIESVVILLIAWSNVLGVQYLLPTGKNAQFTTSVTIGAILNIILNIPLIFIWKSEGAMVATVISEMGVTMYQLYVVRNELKLSKLFVGIWKYFVSGMLMFIVVFLLVNIWKFNMIHMFFEVILGVVIYGLGLIITKSKILKQLQYLRK